jgi:methionyl-tRNA formyltransferase
MEIHGVRVVYFGMAGAFSRPPLEALLRAGFSVAAVALPALRGASLADSDAPFVMLPRHPMSSTSRRPLPLLAPVSDTSTIVQLAAARDIPVLELRRLADPRTVAALAAYAPDVICVACFSRRIPPSILHLPRWGCLNVHPSLLPAKRGPDPLFWTFRDGDAETGVTVHEMNEGLDSGPIVVRRALPVPDGISEADLERACATVGGELLVEALRGLMDGSLTPQPQDEGLATTHSWPSEDDYIIAPDRPAWWAFNFARGISGRAQPIHIVTPHAAFRLVEPLGYDATATLDAPYSLEGEELALQCAPGILYARVRREIR